MSHFKKIAIFILGLSFSFVAVKPLVLMAKNDFNKKNIVKENQPIPENLIDKDLDKKYSEDQENQKFTNHLNLAFNPLRFDNAKWYDQNYLPVQLCLKLLVPPPNRIL